MESLPSVYFMYILVGNYLLELAMSVVVTF